MSTWDDYPTTYRDAEVQRIVRAVQAGDSASVLGLSGAGKSNVMGFLAHCAQRVGAPANHRFALVDCNRLAERTPDALFRLIRRAIATRLHASVDDYEALDVSIAEQIGDGKKLTLLLDRFDDVAKDADRALFNNLRSLRDAHKYALTYVIATRHPLDAQSEMAELLYANTIWIGPLSVDDARWNVARYAQRFGAAWGGDVADKLIELSRGYPSLLKACAEAYAAGGALDLDAMAQHPAVKQRVDEFWADQPSDDEIKLSGLAGHPLLMRGRAASFDTAQLTAKEHLLLTYLQSRASEVCEKDDIIRAVWPEDKVLQRGIRDDSLAQLVRRLREKIEPDAATPKHILTVPGRGYRFVKA